MTDATFWNAIAERYAAKPVEDPDAFERKIEITKALLRAHDVVLEVGCGTGSLALRLAPALAHLHGVDLSSEMIRIARAKVAASAARNITFHYRLLKPGGCFVSSTPCLAESRVPMGAILKIMKWVNKAPWVGVFSRESGGRARVAGLGGVEHAGFDTHRHSAYSAARRPTIAHAGQKPIQPVMIKVAPEAMSDPPSMLGPYASPPPAIVAMPPSPRSARSPLPMFFR